MSLAEIDRIVNARIDPQGPGAAVAVLRGGQVIHSKGYGVAQLEWGHTITPDTVFGIGSVTKPFTAAAILLLRAEGKLALTDPITTYLPDYQTHGQAVTLAHLLTHTSGIPNFVTQPGFWERVAPHDHDHAQLRALFEELPPHFAPGERYSYSNSAYCLLGMIIERLSGMPYAEFIRERIFLPLGMTRSCYLTAQAIIPRRAEGYAPATGGYERARSMSTTLQYAAGALGSTIEDLARWDLALREGRLLDASAYAEATTPTTLTDGRTVGYGLGWGLSHYRGRRVIHHAGGVPGYSAFYGRFPDDDLSLIVLSNLGQFHAAGMAQGIADLLLGLPTPQRAPITLSQSALERMTGAYDTPIGEALDITLRDGALHVSGELTCDLIPLSETTFGAATDPDTEVRFEGDGPEGFERVTVVVPFYWYTVMRRHARATM